MKQAIKIKEDSFFKGTYSGSGDLELHGSFEGSLNVTNLHIKKSGILDKIGGTLENLDKKNIKCHEV